MTDDERTFLPPGVEEAPADGTFYGRQDRQWLSIPLGQYGAMTMATPAAVSVSSGTPTKIGGTVAAGILKDFSVTTTGGGRITYDGGDDIAVKIAVAASVTSGSNNVVMSAYIAKNGTIIARSRIDRKIGAGSDEAAFALTVLEELQTSDFLEVFLDVGSGTVNLTIEHMSMNVVVVGRDPTP